MRQKAARTAEPATHAQPSRFGKPLRSPKETTYRISPPRLRIRELPVRLQPREMFDRLGPEGVPDEVLVALILRSGMHGCNVADLARRLLTEYFPSLTELSRASVDEIETIRGVGRVKAQMLKAALELGRRMATEPQKPAIRIQQPADAACLLRGKAQVLDCEIFWILPLDTKNRLRRVPVEISRGLLDASLVHPREVFRPAIQAGSAALVLVHNHPSGDPTPSDEDLSVTRQLVEAGRILGIRVLDHIILGRAAKAGTPDYISLREAQLVSFEE